MQTTETVTTKKRATRKTDIDIALERGLTNMMRLRTPSGSFRGEYAGTLFLIPYYVATYHILGLPLPEELRSGLTRYLWSQQHSDGGFGLDIESPSYVVSSVTNYVALRMMGVPADDSRLVRCREWFLPRHGGLAASSWGKFLLAMLGIYDYEGLQPLMPEMWLVPESLPIHPKHYWVHCRVVYMPMSYLYAKRFTTPLTPTLASLRGEIYEQPYEQIDWKAARSIVAKSDAYTEYTRVLKASFKALGVLEKFHSSRLRKRATEVVLDHIRSEDESTAYLGAGPLNKVLNAICWYAHDPKSPHIERHVDTLLDYVWFGDDGAKVKSYCSSEVWDTAFAMQAIEAAGAQDNFREAVTEGFTYLSAEQCRTDVASADKYYRDRTRGGWSFGPGRQSWPVTDCTAEALKAIFGAERLGLTLGEAHVDDAVDLILAYQNDEGGWPTYEKTRGPRWLEAFNPSDFFAEIMIEYSYSECTSSCMQALARYRDTRRLSRKRRRQIDRALARSTAYLLRVQRDNGSWEGFWGVTFTYGTWFCIEGLRATGLPVSHPAITKAAQFLLGKQRADGGWSETIESSRQRRYVEAESSQTVQTSWAVMGLVAAGMGTSDAVKHGVEYLANKQLPDGSWAKEHVAGVTNRNCAIDYVAYWSIFPVWAIAVARRAQAHS